MFKTVKIIIRNSEWFSYIQYSKGSVIAKIELVFNREFADRDNETKLANAVKKGKVGDLEVDKNSFKIDGEHCICSVSFIRIKTK